MDRDELKVEIDRIFEPALDDDTGLPVSIPPHKRLWDNHRLDISYWIPDEFSSMSQFSRLVQDPTDPINKIRESLNVPDDLFWAGIRLFGDSLLAYSDVNNSWRKMGWGPLQYYPPILMVFWAGFEAFVRLYSEMLVHVVSGMPSAIQLFLLEEEEYVEKGEVRKRIRNRPVLERYWTLLKYGYGYAFDKGSKIWQKGETVEKKRNQFVHYEVESVPSLKTYELWSYLESILLLFFKPSVDLKLSVFPSQFEIYWPLAELRPLIEDFEERPIQKGWRFSPYIFSCSFNKIDDSRYPPFSKPLGESKGSP